LLYFFDKVFVLNDKAVGRNEKPCGKVAETAEFLCLLDRNPMFAIHYLVVPKIKIDSPDGLKQKHIELIKRLDQYVVALIKRWV